MPAMYSSKETGFQCYLMFSGLTQGEKETVDAFYARFTTAKTHQTRYVVAAEDEFMYTYMFMEQLRPEIMAEILRLPESKDSDILGLWGILELAKCAEQTVISNPSQTGAIRKGRRHRNGGSHPDSGKGNGGASSGYNAGTSTVPDCSSKNQGGHRLTSREKGFLQANIDGGGGRYIFRAVQAKSEWREWARKDNLCIKCARKGHRAKDCSVPEKEPGVTHNIDMLNSTQGSNAMDIESYCSSVEIERLCAMAEQRNTLMLYDCEVNKSRGTTTTDSGATKNFISKKYALLSNLKIDKANTQDVLLPNGNKMRILGECTFEMRMSEWKGNVHATVIDIQAEFDVVLGLEWMIKEDPIPHWDTLDWYVQTDDGIVCIPHRTRMQPKRCVGLRRPKLTVLDSSEIEDLSLGIITAKEAKNILRRGGLGILHYAREYKEENKPRLNNIRDLGDVSSPKLQTLLDEYQDIFREELPEGLPPRREIDHVIDTGNEKPVNRNAYPLSAQQLREQARQVEDLLKRGLIRESSSPWGAPVLFVAKKTGEWRMCIDYRALNAKTQKNAYPLPRIQECIDRLGKASNLSSVDLLSGYWQIRLSKDAVAKSAFNTRHGKYEFLVMPFGLTNAPATFQTLMNSILRPYIDKFVLVYLDDILVYSNSEEERIEHLRLVFEALRGVGLFAQPLKCMFNKPTVEFCGHIVGQGPRRCTSCRLKVIQEWPRPKTVHDVRQFYGLCNYYRRFIRGFSAIGAPLSDLFKFADNDKRKNSPVVWTTACEAAFERMKRAITSAPVLQQIDENKPYVIETDSSDFANGMALYQESDDGKLHPVAFEGRKLHGAELRYPTHEKELLAIKDALLKWRSYVDNGLPITVITDHDSLKYMNTMKNPSKRLARWIDEFQQYNLQIRYRPGKQAVVPDALSRPPDHVVLNAIMLGRGMENPLYLNSIARTAGRLHSMHTRVSRSPYSSPG